MPTQRIPPSRVTVRNMAVEDIAPVYRLGEKVFDTRTLPTLNRTWDPYEVAFLFTSESELSLVAEQRGRVVGFCMGTTVEKPGRGWSFGYVIWLGVASEARRGGVGRLLLRELLRRMREEGARYVLLDTEESNTPALDFFKRMGFQDAGRRQVWLWRGLGGKGKRLRGRAGNWPTE